MLGSCYSFQEDGLTVVDVKRVNEHIMCLKVLIGERLVTCICSLCTSNG